VTAYLGREHPLAGPARQRCRREHGTRSGALLGGVACGACWEQTIRADERLAVEFDLPGDPPAADRSYVDPVAVERATAGQRVRLSDAERAELARRVYAGQVPWPVVARLGISGTRLRSAQAESQAVAS
jgi:hypothetical protein